MASIKCDEMLREHFRRATEETPHPQPLRGANIGCADIISPAGARGANSQLPVDSPSPAHGRGGRGVRGFLRQQVRNYYVYSCIFISPRTPDTCIRVSTPIGRATAP
jgi:hypothetical protein